MDVYETLYAYATTHILNPPLRIIRILSRMENLKKRDFYIYFQT